MPSCLRSLVILLVSGYYMSFPGEKCVTDIAESLSMTQSAISHQLRVLKNNRLVRFRRDGKTIYYSLDDDHVRSIIEKGVEHVLEMGGS